MIPDRAVFAYPATLLAVFFPDSPSPHPVLSNANDKPRQDVRSILGWLVPRRYFDLSFMSPI